MERDRKFQDPDLTADGRSRASVRLAAFQTLWFNTGTLCNIECRHCYMESSPLSNRLAFLTLSELCQFLDEIEALSLSIEEIGFTGGEPFVNPDLIEMLRETLARGYRALVLTNAMRPMQRPRVKAGLLEIGEELKGEENGRLTFRVSLDHYTWEVHERERGRGSWAVALAGLQWLSDHGFGVRVAGRTCWGEAKEEARRGYARLFVTEGIRVDADDPSDLALFPEMDDSVDVPEITEDCWDILGKHPADVMCAWSRMIVKRKDAAAPVVLACTLIPHDRQFELGASLAEASEVVKLNHPRCAQFCVLGGGTCCTPRQKHPSRGGTRAGAERQERDKAG